MAGIADPTTLLPKFGLSEFRPGQRDVVDALAAGQDVMCVMPTGGGKSLCYQLPSLSRRGTTIVVSPLIALMKDQVDTLQSLGIAAKLINSSLTTSEQSDVMREMADGSLDLVYVAPERLRNGRFLSAIEAANVTLLAVDEAHCVSEWGHDFRPDYSRLGQFRQRYLAGVQTIALTATATPLVRDDIAKLLELKSPTVFVTGFARTNLRFTVNHAKTDQEKNDRLTDYLDRQPGAGIIYAATRKRCEELADWLPEKARRPIGVYHAGLEPAQRRQVQEDFMSGKLSAIVATNAFGMGIDKADIRFVAHYNMPGSLEAYYQEAGRAGRDGQESDCLLLFSYSDRYIQEFFIENRYPSQSTVKKVYEYLLSRPEDPIELTLDQVREAIDVKDGSEAIGTAQTLLAKAGVLRRMDSNANYAVVRIDSNAATMLDFLPKEAKLRRRVMLAIEKIVGRRRGEDVYVRPATLMEMAEVDRDQLARTLRELRKLRAFDYVPPFRGRAIHFVERETAFDQLDIDFDELDRRKRAEFEKLESVIEFARTSHCRQRVILNYFGETDSTNCGTCDRCRPADGSVGRGSDVSLTGDLKGVNTELLQRGIQVVLSGVTRMHGRFGKNMVAQMLCGSKNKKLQQWKLHRLSTYGLLSALRQSEVVAVMDALIESGLLVQKEVDDRRPTLHVSEPGRQVMLAKVPMPSSLQMPFPLAKRLAIASGHIESGDVQTSSAGTDQDDQREGTTTASDELVEQLKRWRRKTSAALGIPAFRVLTNATIDRIAEMIPETTDQLESISGIGPATMEQFGYDIIELIGQSGLVDSAELATDADPIDGADPNLGPAKQIAGAEPGVSSDQCQGVEREPAPPGRAAARPETSPADSQSGTDPPDRSSLAAIQPPDSPEQAPERKNEDVSDAYWTWKLFQDGYTAEQVAEIRRCDLAALAIDLVAAGASGYPIDPAWMTLARPTSDRSAVKSTSRVGG